MEVDAIGYWKTILLYEQEVLHVSEWPSIQSTDFR